MYFGQLFSCLNKRFFIYGCSFGISVRFCFLLVFSYVQTALKRAGIPDSRALISLLFI